MPEPLDIDRIEERLLEPGMIQDDTIVCRPTLIAAFIAEIRALRGVIEGLPDA